MSKPYISKVRLFENDFLERFTHVHPIVPLLLWTPVISYLYWHSVTIGLSSLQIWSWSLVGLIVWTLTEYVLHRFAFHFPAESRAGKRFVYILHGLHHDDPNDPTRLVMPPVPAIFYASLLFFAFRAVVGPEAIYPFFACFMIGYLAYDYIHYYVHHFVPRNAVGKYLRRYHLVHHFKDHSAKWGVSSPLWDYVFGTVEEKKN